MAEVDAAPKSSVLMPTEALHLQRFKDLLQGDLIIVPPTMMPGGDLDATLCRYLRARKWDVQKAFVMLKATIKWRAENDVDSYLSRFLPEDKEAVVRRNKQDGNLGVSKKGLPIYIEKSASTNLGEMAAAGVTVDDFVFTQIRLMEYLVRILMKDASVKAGRLIDGNVVISDFEGAHLGLLSAPNLKLFQRMSTIYSDHFPELMTRCLVVNSPMVINIIYKALTVFMDVGTRDKVKFVGPKELAEEIDEALLPPAYCGTRSGGYMTDREGFVPECWLEMDRRITAWQLLEGAAEKQQTNTGSTDGAAKQMAGISICATPACTACS